MYHGGVLEVSILASALAEVGAYEESAKTVAGIDTSAHLCFHVHGA